MYNFVFETKHIYYTIWKTPDFVTFFKKEKC